MPDETERVLVFLKALNGDVGATQLCFHQQVLDKYRGQSAFRVIRTNTAGRLRCATWTLDFGISDGDRLIHLPARDASERLPAAERDHWSQHAFSPPLSRNFLMMRLGGGACIEDGDVRDWK